MGDSLLPKSLHELEVMETLYFQWGQSQEEEATPFSGKTHLFQEGQSNVQPLARKNNCGNSNFTSRSAPCRVCEPYVLVGLNTS